MPNSGSQIRNLRHKDKISVDGALNAAIGMTRRWRRDPASNGILRREARPRSTISVRAGVLPWVPFWLSLGIGAWLASPVEPGIAIYAVLGLLTLGGLAAIGCLSRRVNAGRMSPQRGDWLRILTLAVLLVAAGGEAAGLRSALVAAPVLRLHYSGPVEGRVARIDRSASDRLRLTLDQVVLDNLPAGRTPARVRISLMGQDSRLPVPGQRIMLAAHLGPPSGPTEPGGFDYRRMAWFERLGAVGYSRSPVMTVGMPRPGGMLFLHRLRMRLSAAIQEGIGGQAGAVAAAMMTGDRSAVTEETNAIMRVSNLYHIISISGLHMSMLSGFVYAALRLGGVLVLGLMRRGVRQLHKYAAAGALAAAACYALLSGGDVATTRSFIMVAVMLIAILADRRAISLRTVAVAAIIILFTTPEALASPGFQMSFAATVVLILSAGPWQRVSPAIPALVRPIALLFLSSLVAGIATSPVAAAHFGRVAPYGLFANLLAVPVIGLIVMPAGVIALLLVPLGLEGVALWCMGLGTEWMLAVASFTAGLNGATTLLAAPPTPFLPLFGTGLCLLLLAPITGATLRPRLFMARRLTGVAIILGATVCWGMHVRPQILISAEGDAVGIMTPEGRAVSKPKGGAFTVSYWLEADGDPAAQETAAARPFWSGGRGLRTGQLSSGPYGRKIHHITGKGAVDRAGTVCTGGAIIVSTVDLHAPGGPAGDCLLIDQKMLRGTGAMAATVHAAGIGFLTVSQYAGRRRWLPAPSETGDPDDVQ